MMFQDKSGDDLEVFVEARVTGRAEGVGFMVSTPSREVLVAVGPASSLLV